MTNSFSHQSDEVLTTLRGISAVIPSENVDSFRPVCSSIGGPNQVADDVLKTRRHVECRSDRGTAGCSDHSTSSLLEFYSSVADESPGQGVARGVLLMACLYLALATIVVAVRYGTMVLVPSVCVIVSLAFLVHRLLAHCLGRRTGKVACSFGRVERLRTLPSFMVAHDCGDRL